jgi:hypothetical protein
LALDTRPRNDALRSGTPPLSSCDSRLTENDREKLDPDVSAMWIGYRQHAIASLHEFVFAAGVRALESKAAQSRDELAAADGAPRRHQLACLTSTVTPPNRGTTRPRATRTRTHSSTTSAR